MIKIYNIMKWNFADTKSTDRVASLEIPKYLVLAICKRFLNNIIINSLKILTFND